MGGCRIQGGGQGSSNMIGNTDKGSWRLYSQEGIPGHSLLGENFPNPADAKQIQTYTLYCLAFVECFIIYGLQGRSPHKNKNPVNPCTEGASGKGLNEHKMLSPSLTQ